MPVFLRIRPLNSNESAKKVLIPIDFKRVVLKPANENKGLRAASIAFGQASHEFEFSRVFDECATQDDVFRVVLLDRVSEFLEGINVLIFAYGTTSSGKTFSLQGTSNNAGMVPRALESIFRSATLLKQPSPDGAQDANSGFLFAPYGFNEIEELSVEESEKRRKEKASILRFVRSHDSGLQLSSCTSLETNRRDSQSTVGRDSPRLLSDDIYMDVPFAFKETAAFVFWVSFVEIYNEVVYDLLDPEFVAATLKSSNRPFKPKKNALDLRADKKGRVFIKGVRWYPVNSAAEAIALLHVGRRCQAVGATRLNTASSRSHAIFSLRALRVSSRGNANNIDFRMASLGSCSELVFCDLAGSERCLKAETTNNSCRLREANSINTSLLALGKCITALRTLGGRTRPGAPSACYPVVPYRESRLTRLFANFFSPPGLGVASSKACLLVNAAPCVELVDETLHALKFSALASQVILPQTEEPSPPAVIPEVADELEEGGSDSSRRPSGFDPDTIIVPGIDSTAAATAAIEKQLRAHLLKKGFQLRCSSSLIGRKASGSALVNTSSGMSTLPVAVSPIFGSPLANNNADSSTEEPATLVRKPAGDRLGSLAHFEWMEDIESDLAGLSREALISVVLEVVSALADTLPAEVEAAKSETNARLTKNYGDELLRMEEQYESLLAKQEREYEEKLRILESKQYRQRRRTLTQERLSPSSRKPMVKTRRVEEDEYATDTEEVDASVVDDECPSCPKLTTENAELRSKLDEAKADLAEQSEAMVALSEQRDALQVDLRRAQFYAQIAKMKLVMNGQTNVFPPLIEPGSGPETPQTIVSRNSPRLPGVFPPLLSPVYRSSDADIIPPTPDTVVLVGKRKCEVVSASDLRAENQQLLSQLAQLRVDFGKSNSVSVIQQEKEAVTVKKEMPEEIESLGSNSRNTVVRMNSFLSHEMESEKQEALAEMKSRCSSLNAELRQVRSAHNEALSKLEELQNQLSVYEQLKKRLEETELSKQKSGTMVDADVQTEDQCESSKVDPRSSHEPAFQNFQPKRAPRGRGRQTKGPGVTRKTAGVTTSRGGRARGRKQTVSHLSVENLDTAPQFDDSEEENAWSERLARDLTNIQLSNSASVSLAVPGTANGTDLQSVTTEEETENEEPEEKTMNKARRRGRGVTRKRHLTVPGETGSEPGGSDRTSGGFRKLAPLSETIKFLEIDGSAEPTPRPRRNLRPRK
nr:kinesin family 0A [Hymenolepis microstoma]